MVVFLKDQVLTVTVSVIVAVHMMPKIKKILIRGLI